MGKLTFVIGGARSGKSAFAEKLVSQLSHHVMYIATSLPTDEAMIERIKKHIAQRPPHWTTVEQYKKFDHLSGHTHWKNTEVCLLDCITLLVTNLMFEKEIDFDHISVEALNFLESEIHCQIEEMLHFFKSSDKHLIMVSNEVGLGLVPAYKLGNYFRDIAGRVNQKIAAEADDVFFLVSGIPMKIK